MAQATTRNRIIDTALQLKDAGLIAADDICQVGGADAILDVGGMAKGELYLDVSAIEIASNDELYEITLEGSNASDFSSGVVELSVTRMGAVEALDNVSADSVVGQTVVPFSTERQGTVYRYVRLAVNVAGTVATGINFTAWITA